MEGLGPEGQEDVEEGESRRLVDLSQLVGLVRRHVDQVRLDGGQKVRVERRDEVVVVLLLVRMVEHVPGEVVDVPGVCEVDVGEAEGYRPLGLGERGDMEIGAQRDRRGYRSLMRETKRLALVPPVALARTARPRESTSEAIWIP